LKKGRYVAQRLYTLTPPCPEGFLFFRHAVQATRLACHVTRWHLGTTANQQQDGFRR
jgi:hypothetical protein